MQHQQAQHLICRVPSAAGPSANEASRGASTALTSCKAGWGVRSGATTPLQQNCSQASRRKSMTVERRMPERHHARPGHAMSCHEQMPERHHARPGHAMNRCHRDIMPDLVMHVMP
eukprot:1160534-Pelagomonas_calceolata.AAC.12